MTFSATILVDEKVKGCVSTALAMGELRIDDPIVKAANAVPAAFFNSNDGLFTALFASNQHAEECFVRLDSAK